MENEKLQGVYSNLDEYALKYTESLIAIECGVSLKVLHDFLRQKGVDFRARRDHQIRVFIRENYRRMSAGEIAAALCMEKKAIWKRARAMGLQFPTGGDRRSAKYREVLGVKCCFE